VAVKREVEREMMRALLRLLSSFPPAPKYEQELGAFKEWYPLDQRQTTTAKNEWNVCYNMADTHTHRLAFLIQKQADEVKTFHLPNSNPPKVF
jgi:hypothetical protein